MEIDHKPIHATILVCQLDSLDGQFVEFILENIWRVEKFRSCHLRDIGFYNFRYLVFAIVDIIVWQSVRNC